MTTSLSYLYDDTLSSAVIHHHTLWYTIIRYDTLSCTTIHYHTLQYTIIHYIILHDTLRYTMIHSMIHYHTLYTQWYTLTYTLQYTITSVWRPVMFQICAGWDFTVDGGDPKPNWSKSAGILVKDRKNSGPGKRVPIVLQTMVLT